MFIDLVVKAEHSDSQIGAKIFDFHILASKELGQEILRNALGELLVQLLKLVFLGGSVGALRTVEVKMVHIT